MAGDLAGDAGALGEVVLHAGIPAATQRFEPHLLQRVVERGGDGVARLALVVEVGAVVFQRQRREVHLRADVALDVLLLPLGEAEGEDGVAEAQRLVLGAVEAEHDGELLPAGDGLRHLRLPFEEIGFDLAG